MFGNFAPPIEDYVRILPEIILALCGTLIMFIEGVYKEESHHRPILGWITLAGLAAALWGTVLAFLTPGTAFSDMIVVDGFATFFRALVIVVGLLTVLGSMSYLRQERANAGEYYGLILFSICGQCVMAAANELIMVFIGLEISSIATYILAGYLRDDKRNNESALKYFLLGSFATAFFLYGIAWIYGITGSTNLGEIRLALLNKDLGLNMAAGWDRRRADVRRPCIQSLGGPVPGVGARRLPGRAGSRERVHVSRPESCGFRDSDAHLRHCVRPHCRPLGAVSLVFRAADDDHRQLRCATQIEHQAAARIQLDRACRIRARRDYGALGDRDCGGDVLPGRVCVHECGRLRCRDSTSRARVSAT